MSFPSHLKLIALKELAAPLAEAVAQRSIAYRKFERAQREFEEAQRELDMRISSQNALERTIRLIKAAPEVDIDGAVARAGSDVAALMKKLKTTGDRPNG